MLAPSLGCPPAHTPIPLIKWHHCQHVSWAAWLPDCLLSMSMSGHPAKVARGHLHPHPISIALKGGDTPCTCPSQVQFRCAMRSMLCLSSPQFYCVSSLWHFVCLVCSFRYNGLATLALVAFGRVWALRARCGSSGCHALETGGYPPPRLWTLLYRTSQPIVAKGP